MMCWAPESDDLGTKPGPAFYNHLCLDKLLRLSEPQCLHLSNGDEYENLLYWLVIGICKYIANVSTEPAPTNHSLNVHCSYYLGRPGV